MSPNSIGTSLVTSVSEEEDPTAERPQGIPSRMETILLVEDDQMVRTLARLILELSGYNVLEAASGIEAMEVCKDLQGPVHLLLTDVVMPKMSGPELSKEVMKKWPDVRVLYMSGHADDVVARYDVGTDVNLLQKPFSPDTLALKVRETLDLAAQVTNLHLEGV
jgi:DNA-binding NtrC family response regulator